MRTKKEPNLAIEVGNVRFKNPILAASGVFGNGEEYGELFDLARLGGFVTKSTTLELRGGNKPPRIVETPCGMLNSIGLTNVGIEKFIAEEVPKLSDYNTEVILSLAGREEEDYYHLTELVAELPFQVIELNLSCPNVKEGGMLLGASPENVHDITRKVRGLTAQDIWVKLTPNVTDIGTIAEAAEAGKADAVALINTLVGLDIDIETFRPKLGNITGGLSGPAILPVALALVWKVYNRVSIPIVGIGGISSYQDVIKFMLAGASVVQIGSAIFHDPALPFDTPAKLKEFCVQRGIENLSSLTGQLNCPG